MEAAKEVDDERGHKGEATSAVSDAATTYERDIRASALGWLLVH